MLYKMNPTLTDPVVATTYFFTPHDSPTLSFSLARARACLQHSSPLNWTAILSFLLA